MADSIEIKQIIRELNTDAIFIKGFDEAIYGTGKVIGGKTVAVYDADECLNILINGHEMDELEAWEHFNNTVMNGTYNLNKPMFTSDWRLAVNAGDILKDIKVDKNRTISDIMDEIKKKKEEDESE